MDYLNFFGLKEDPFRLTPDPAYFFPSSGHNEGLMLMDYAIDQKEGFLLLIGDPGTGKTTLLKVFLDKWKDRADIAMILTPRLSPGEFLAAVAEDLGIGPGDKNKNEIIRELRNFVTRQSGEGRRVIIIVDEAQNLPLDTLEELRLLSNLETDKDKLLQIMLIGQPELEAKLTAIKLRQLNQRITSRVHLRSFSAEETQEYINYRVIKAGRRNLRIHKKAASLVHTITRGIPRLINMLTSRALMAAYLEEQHVVAPGHVRHAAQSLNHHDMQFERRSGLVPAAAGVLVLTALTVAVYLYLPDKPSETSEHTIKGPAINRPVEVTPPPVEKIQKPEVHQVSDPAAKTDSRDPALASASHAVSPVQTANPMIAKKADAAPEKIIVETPPVPAEAKKDLLETVQPPDVNTVPDEERGEDPAVQEEAGDFKFISITADVAFIRHWPSIDAGKAGWATRGSHLLVLGETLDERDIRWYQIAYQGEKKWISGEVVEAVGWSAESR